MSPHGPKWAFVSVIGSSERLATGEGRLPPILNRRRRGGEERAKWSVGDKGERGRRGEEREKGQGRRHRFGSGGTILRAERAKKFF